MRRSLRKARAVKSWLLMCAVTGVAGCDGMVPPPAPGNQLPFGVPSDTTSYREQVALYPASGPVHNRKRKGKCFLCSVAVNINARGNTLAIDPITGPATPVAVAHLVNTDKHNREKYYGLLPEDSAEYDLWVGQKGGGSTKTVWWLVETSHVSNSVTAGIPTDLNYCHSPRGPNDPTTPDADFAQYQNHGRCDYDITQTASKVSMASLFPSPILSSFIAHVAAILAEYAKSGGGWIDCNNGCCT